jgi:RNA polymerase sigma factor (sigma-70 family)
MDKIKIIIAEDHLLVRQGLKTMLSNEKDIEIIDICSNGEEAIQLAEKLKPDIIIMDVSMPVVDGIEASEIIYKKKLSCKIIILTMHDEEIFVKYVKEKFISGYVLKENAFEDLLYAIRSVYRGGKYISPDLAEKVLIKNNSENIIKSLTIREKEILKLIIEGMSVKEIAEKLIISKKTVETHKSRIMKKFNVNKSTELVKKALQENFF